MIIDDALSCMKFVKFDEYCCFSVEPEHHTRYQGICERHPQSPRGGEDEKKGQQVDFK